MNNILCKINRTLLYSGLVTFSFFVFVLFVLIPLYIEEPGFIPPFAVKSDTWPKTIATLGAAMGLLLIINALKTAPNDNSIDNEDILQSIYLIRFGKIILSFIVFATATPYLGFLVSTTLLAVFLIYSIQTPANYQKSIIIGLLFTLLIFFIFTQAINVRFPMGIIFKSLF